ncbi:MAG: AEC family transporter [Xanthomonadales bacterium]|nr:AEC family transporter [Xanthomonadales bacterium]
MFNELFSVIAPILICAGLGYGWARKGLDYPVDFVTRLVMNIGAPCLIVSSFSKSGIDIGKMAEISAAVVVILLVMLALGGILIRMMGLKIGTFLPSLLFPNIGNMGLPLCLFAFGETGLALGLTVFLVIFALQMSLGIILVAGRGNLRGLIGQPVLWATAIAVVLVSTGSSLPGWLDNTTSILGGATIPLMLITLGVSLAQLKVAQWKHSLLFSLIRVLGGFGLAVLVAELFRLEGVDRGVLILQSSMPVAVFNYLLALRYQREPGEVAGMVVLSTLLAFALLPFIVGFVLA